MALLVAGIGLLYRAFIKGDIVVGSMYREQVARADKAELRADKMEIQAERNTEAIQAVAATVKAAGERGGRRGA